MFRSLIGRNIEKKEKIYNLLGSQNKTPTTTTLNDSLTNKQIFSPFSNP